MTTFKTASANIPNAPRIRKYNNKYNVHVHNSITNKYVKSHAIVRDVDKVWFLEALDWNGDGEPMFLNTNEVLLIALFMSELESKK